MDMLRFDNTNMSYYTVASALYRVTEFAWRLIYRRAHDGRHVRRRSRIRMINRMDVRCAHWLRRSDCHHMCSCMRVRKRIDVIIHTLTMCRTQIKRYTSSD